MGTTLRGMLLNAYAFATLGTIMMWAAMASFIGAAVMLTLGILGLHHAHKVEGVDAPAIESVPPPSDPQGVRHRATAHAVFARQGPGRRLCISAPRLARRLIEGRVTTRLGPVSRALPQPRAGHRVRGPGPGTPGMPTWTSSASGKPYLSAGCSVDVTGRPRSYAVPEQWPQAPRAPRSRSGTRSAGEGSIPCTTPGCHRASSSSSGERARLGSLGPGTGSRDTSWSWVGAKGSQ